MSEEQTVSTLRFATQAKAIKNHAQVNEVLDDAAKINRMKKEMAALRAELEAARVQSVGNREAELQEALDEATREKENLLVRVQDANEKILTSSQAAPPRKSMMPKKSNKLRRETWCGPAMRKNMRMSMFQRPLVPLAPLPSEFEPDLTLEKNTRANSNSSFQLTSNMSFEQDLGAAEKQRLVELEEDEEEEEQLQDSVFPEHLMPQPIQRKKRTGTVSFATSPSMFVSPLRKRQKEDLLNLTDGGTPKAVIRENFRRVSQHLSKREQELVALEQEHKELQEFTRLEDEAGILEDRRSSVASNGSDGSAERMRFLEKSFADAQALNVALTKDLAVLRQEHSQVVERTEELQMEHDSLREGFEMVCKTEGEAVEKVKTLEEKVTALSGEAKRLKESNVELEGVKCDFDVKFEMAIDKKEAKIKELQEMLGEAYKESGSSVEEIKARNEKAVEQKRRISELELQLQEKEALVVEAKEQKVVLEELKEGMQALSQELDRLTSEKAEVVKQVTLEQEKVATAEDKVVVLEADLKQKTEEGSRIQVEKDNLELSNMAMLGDLDDLQKKYDDAEQRKSELLVSSAELERFVIELKEEIQQLKQEVMESNKAKEESDVENQQLKVDLEDAIMAKEEVEASKEEVEHAVNNLKTAKEEAERARDEAEAAKQSLEEFINTSSNTDEIEGLKKELREMEEQLASASTAAVITKLSATLVGLEESVLAAADCSVMPSGGGGEDSDITFGNQTIGGGVPMEVRSDLLNFCFP